MDVLFALLVCVAFLSASVCFIREDIIETRCRLQGQACDPRHLDMDKRCCSGTSCRTKKFYSKDVSVCLMCRDLGELCNKHKGCCKGLRCQQITEYSSVCNPDFYRPSLKWKNHYANHLNRN